VTITARGIEVLAHARQVLDAQFDQLLDAAGVDADQYRTLIERLHAALVAKHQEVAE
jgi:predicted ATPase